MTSATTIDSYRCVADRDSDLAGLALLFDADGLAEKIRNSSSVALELDLKYLRYKPGRRCLGLYRANVEGTPTWCYAKAHNKTSWPKQRQRQERFAERTNARGWPLFFADERLTLHRFPSDPQIEVFRALGTPTRQHRFLKRLFPERPELWNGVLKPIVYKPERRCVMQLLVDGEPRAAVKFFDARTFSTALANAKRFESVQPLRVPRLIGRSNRYRALGLEWLRGVPLREHLTEHRCDCDTVSRVGRALAEIHAQRPNDDSRQARASFSNDFAARAATIGALLPKESRRVSDIARQLAYARELPSTSLHGDFYAKQVVVSEEVVGILDFDQACTGDVCRDLGNFWAHAWLTAADECSSIFANDALDALRAGYGPMAHHDLDARLQYHKAVGLFDLLPHPFRSHHPDWPVLTALILAEIESQLAEMASSCRREAGHTLSSRCQIVCGDHVKEALWLAPSLDPATFQHSFRKVLPEHARELESHSLGSIRLVRHKRNRRALVEYRYLPNDARHDHVVVLLGKCRAKGVDRRALEIQHDAWNASLEVKSEGDDGFQTPKPLGAIPELGMWLQQKAVGVEASIPLYESSGEHVAKRIADAIATFHGSSLAFDRRHSIHDEVRILEQRLRQFSAKNPIHRDAIDHILSGCRRFVGELSGGLNLPIHRDFYPAQVLYASKLSLVDLDLCCMGNPAVDIGNFVAHMIEFGIRRHGCPDRFHVQRMAFIERYLSRISTTRREIEAFTTLSLARHIQLSTTFPDRTHTTCDLIQCVQQRLDVKDR